MGYCGSRSGADMDHVYSYLDMFETSLFGGVVHRPITPQSRAFLLRQPDKIKGFLEDMIPKCISRTICKRTFRLA